MIGYLVRSFYDFHGSFDNVNAEKWWPHVVKMAGSINPIEYCFRCLGYPADNLYTSKDRYETRKMAVKTEGQKKIDDRFMTTFSTRTGAMFAYNFKPSHKELPVHDHPYKDLVLTVANYVETNEFITIFDPKISCNRPLISAFMPLKFNTDFYSLKKMAVNYVPTLCQLLNTAVVDGKLENSRVVNGLIVTPLSFDVDKVAEAVALQIGCRNYTMANKHYFYFLKNMSTFQPNFPNNPTQYLSMLDIAHCYDTSIRGVVEMMGFEFVNQLDIFEETGAMIYQLNDENYAVVSPLSSEKTDFVIVGLSELKNMYDTHSFGMYKGEL